MEDMRMNRAKLLVILVALLLTSLPQTGNNFSVEQSLLANPETGRYQLSAEGSVPDVPYVWQEANGLCYWSALSMALQYIGIELDLYSLFAASGCGLSSFYVRTEDIMTLVSGPMLRPTVTTISAIGGLYGVNFTYYVDYTTELGSIYAYRVWSQGYDFVHLEGRTPMFDMMQETIDLGYPLLISVDPYYLPVEDYDVLRAYGLTSAVTGSGHSIVVTGYDELYDVAYVLDPGVGVIGNDPGYPEDGRYSYNVSYTALNLAWEALGYSSLRVMPGDGPQADLDSRLGEYVYGRLSGNRTSYLKGYGDLYYVSVGEKAFRGMGLDMTINELVRYIEEFNTTQTRMYALMGLGLSTESMMTHQYLSYRTALEVLPELLPDADLDVFIERGSDALPHMASLSHNESLTSLGALPTHDSLLMNTFMGIALRYNDTGNLRASITEYSEDISTISGHLLAIADSWRDAADALATELDLSVGASSDSMAVLVVGVSIIVVVTIAMIFRKLR